MSILSKYFDKIYCVNLDTRPDRLEKVQKEFTRVGFDDISRYSAINGKHVKHSSNLLNGEIGILQTHINIINNSIKENFKNVLIMEDDVCFTDEINKIEEYLKMVPEDWDMIYFGANHISGKALVKINDKIVRLNHSFGLQCVAIKNTLFNKIIEETPKFEKQIDVYYAEWQNDINAYCFHPNIALQEIGFSDIQNKITNYDVFFKNS